MRLGNDFEDGLAVHISNGELFSKSSRSDTRCSGMTRMIVGAVENVVEESLWVELVGGVCWWRRQASIKLRLPSFDGAARGSEEVNEMRSLWGRSQSLHKVHAFIPIVVNIYILSFRNH